MCTERVNLARQGFLPLQGAEPNVSSSILTGRVVRDFGIRIYSEYTKCPSPTDTARRAPGLIPDDSSFSSQIHAAIRTLVRTVHKPPRHTPQLSSTQG